MPGNGAVNFPVKNAKRVRSEYGLMTYRENTEIKESKTECIFGLLARCLAVCLFIYLDC